MSPRAHCDATGGPVATASTGAFDIRNVNLILPFAPAQVEPELSAAFKQVLSLREMGSDAKGLADRHFMETAVRPSRGGRSALYRVKVGGHRFWTRDSCRRECAEDRYLDAMAHSAAMMEPATAAEVAKAREPVSAELASSDMPRASTLRRTLACMVKPRPLRIELAREICTARISGISA